MNILKTIIINIVISIIYIFVQSIWNSESFADDHENQIKQHITTTANNFEDIAGLETIKRDLNASIIIPLKYPHLFFNEILTPCKGLLFYGPPGTGKTTFARAIATESKVPFLLITLSAIENKLFGESSKLISGTFRLAKKMQPVIICFEEIDGFMKKRSEFDQNCNYGLKTELLINLDTILQDDMSSVVVVGCTNVIEQLDDALKRRLSKHIKMPYPSNEDIKKIIKLYAPHLESNIISNIVSQLTSNITGSNIKEIIKQVKSLHVQRSIECTLFQDLLDDENATSLDIKEAIGDFTSDDLVHAFKRNGFIK